MEFRQTKHQVARGARPDGETFNKLLLIKRTSELRATYQIRLLAYRAMQQRKKLVIEVIKSREIVGEKKILSEEESKHALDPRRMTEPQEDSVGSGGG